jgi:hypothetical protein
MMSKKLNLKKQIGNCFPPFLASYGCVLYSTDDLMLCCMKCKVHTLSKDQKQPTIVRAYRARRVNPEHCTALPQRSKIMFPLPTFLPFLRSIINVMVFLRPLYGTYSMCEFDQYRYGKHVCAPERE